MCLGLRVSVLGEWFGLYLCLFVVVVVEIWAASSVILLGYSWSRTKICLSACELYGVGPYGGALVDPQSGIEW